MSAKAIVINRIHCQIIPPSVTGRTSDLTAHSLEPPVYF